MYPIADSDRPVASVASISSCFIIESFPLNISLKGGVNYQFLSLAYSAVFLFVLPFIKGFFAKR
jgi:hypothetical protein